MRLNVCEPQIRASNTTLHPEQKTLEQLTQGERSFVNLCMVLPQPSPLQGLLEIKDTLRPRALRQVYTLEQRTFLVAVCVLKLE